MVVLFGAAGEIRTLGTLLAYTRFPVVLVMTASILLRIGALDSKNDYTKNHSKVKHKFEKCAICRLSRVNAQKSKNIFYEARMRAISSRKSCSEHR